MRRPVFLILVAAVALLVALRLSLGSAEPDDPSLPDLSQDVIEGWIANQDDLKLPPITPTFEGTPPPGFDSWEEAAAWFASQPLDPNAPTEVPLSVEIEHSVGGMAELPNVAGTSLEAPDSSGRNAGHIAGIAAALTLGTVALGGAAWYARKR